MKIKKAYYYFFYQLYKHYEKGPSLWLSDWKAGLTIDILGFGFVFSILIYYTVLIDHYFQLWGCEILLVLYLILFPMPNYFIFHHKNKWKKIVQEFDKLQEKKNRIGGWIVFGVTMLIIINLIFAFYLMSQIDWKQYR